MKRATRKFIVLPLLLLGTSSFSQSIVTTSNTWSNVIYYYWPMYIGSEYIRFTSDTLINDTLYNRVERSLDAFQSEWNFYGYIRENSQKQIYYRIDPVEQEKLIFDFSVNIGDSVIAYGLENFYTPYFYETTYYVFSFDSTLIGDSYRKRINLGFLPGDTNSIIEHWVDSTGSMGGILHNTSIYTGGDGFSLLCFFENGDIKYHNPLFPECFVITQIREQSASYQSVAIYPNPVINSSIIEVYGIKPNAILKFRLFNSIGQEVYAHLFSQKFQFYKKDLQPGVYPFTVEGDQIMSHGTLIIN